MRNHTAPSAPTPTCSICTTSRFVGVGVFYKGQGVMDSWWCGISHVIFVFGLNLHI